MHHSPSPLGYSAPNDAELAAIAEILFNHAGIVIASGKGSMVQSRLAKRLRACGLADYQSYINHVRSAEGSGELREMVSALTTNVTHFFRENHHFDTLRSSALPPLLAKCRSGGRLRIWSAGSSNGQEAYSIAMVIADLEPEFSKYDIRILASDIDPVMIAHGRNGTYDAASVEAIPDAYQKRFLEPVEGGARILQPLREMISFRELNLHDTWPMKGRFDIIFCRNVVIYFAADAQKRLWQRFENILSPGGWIFVGHSERVPLDQGSKLSTAGITTYRLPESPKDMKEATWH